MAMLNNQMVFFFHHFVHGTSWDSHHFPTGKTRGGDRGIAGGGDLKHLGAGRFLLPGELHRERLSLRPP